MNYSTLPEPSPAKSVDLGPALIKLEGVEFSVGEREILRNVSLSIRRGDFVAVTGPNGGGKTTLLRLILGLARPTRGKIEVCQPGIRIGYLPQKSRIDASYPITTREVVASGLLGLKNIYSAECSARVEDALKLVDLSAHVSKPIGVLSGGQLQRALFARAIISRPELLVLDEPLSYLDKHFEAEIYHIIENIARRATVIVVSHEIDRLASMANRHVIVDRTITECRSARHFARIALCE